MQELSLIRPGGLCENGICLIAFAWDSYVVKKISYNDNGSD